MFSKKFTLTLVAVLGFTTGCGIKIGEKNKSDNVAKISGTDCLDQAMTDLKSFAVGEASDEQVESSMTCLQSMLTTFKENVRGQDANSFTPQELGGFINREYMQSSTLSEGFMLQVGKLKSMLLGGEDNRITKTEIDGLIALIERYKPELVNLNPHMKIITGKWVASGDSRANENDFFAAQTALDSVLAKLGQQLAASERSYDLRDMLALVTEAGRSFNMSASTIDLISRAAPFILKFKELFIGPGPALQGLQWSGFAKTAAEAYSQSLRIKYFVTPLGADEHVKKWKAYQFVGVDLAQLLNLLMSNCGRRQVSNTELGELATLLRPIQPELVINAELLEQVGQLKLMLLGSSTAGSAGWAREDFARLAEKIPNIFPHIGSLVASFKYLKTDKNAFKNGALKYDEFNAAETTAHEAVRNISETIEGRYDMAQMKALVENLSATILKDTLKLPENFEKIYQLGVAAKYALSGEAGTSLSNVSIKLLLNVGIRGYANFIEHSNFVSVFNMEDPAFVEQHEKFSPKVKGTATYLILAKPSHVVTTEELTQLVLTAQQQDFLSTNIKKENLDSLFNLLWTNLLISPERRINDGAVLAGLNVSAMLNLSREADIWFMNHKIIVESFQQKEIYSKAELKAKFDRLYRDLESNHDESVRSELPRLLDAKGLMNFNTESFLKILDESNGQYRVQDLIKSNMARALARVLVRSFAGEVTRAVQLEGVNLPEAQTAFNQLKGLVVDLKMVSANAAETFIESRFREANLFLSVGDGDQYASFSEIHHLVLHILSGTARADLLSDLALQKCPALRAIDIKESEFDEDCLIELIYREETPFTSIPQFIKLKEQSEALNKEYYLSLLKAAGYVPNESKKVKLADASLFPHVVQYVEMLFYSHDTNGDAVLTKDEAIQAFPVFRTLIADLVKIYPQILPEDLPGVFVYLLKYTKPPKSLTEKIKFFTFVKDHDCSDGKECQKDWNIQSTRFDLGKIFNFIAEATKPVPTGSPEAPVTPAPTPPETPEPPAPAEP